MTGVLLRGIRLVRAAGSVAVAAASGRFDDQLRAGPVDVCCALQQVGTVDAEPVQSGLDRAGVLTRVACDGWSRCGRVLGLRAASRPACVAALAAVSPRPRRPACRWSRFLRHRLCTLAASFGIQSRV